MSHSRPKNGFGHGDAFTERRLFKPIRSAFCSLPVQHKQACAASESELWETIPFDYLLKLKAAWFRQANREKPVNFACPLNP